ncbi:hypothetical protein [Vibrio sp. 10N.261.55.A7]|uniref:hypothetical protein n=1 Tax=Vibrio sp. 10N.261.55.A7 TaxID=1880851 RepID=UPI000C845D31|nr:hypothetical protein [Vibrio sp. 10N.261.55.A7]PMJ95288.1 hypothetical protein BCU12_05045 [Vibrio sp. 10N.261.55.A7]
MSLYNIANKNLTALTPTTFAAEGLQERQDLQEALKSCIDAIAPDCLVISEEFSDWEDSRRRIDLLAIDRNANLVVIELKRDEVGAHMELQALRYAAMISTMTFEKACDYFEQYIEKEGTELDPRETLLEFIDLDESNLKDFGNDVRIVLASADFGKELTTSVLWLRDKGIDISCVRLAPYRYKDDVLINAEQIIPVPEVEEYQVKFREKRQEQRVSSKYVDKDYSEYQYKGAVYNKRHLSYALLSDWIDKHNPQDLDQLQAAFNGVLRKSVFTLVSDIPENRYKRFHMKEDQQIELESGEVIAISNQWGVGNIFKLIERVKQDGLEAVQSS